MDHDLKSPKPFSLPGPNYTKQRYSYGFILGSFCLLLLFALIGWGGYWLVSKSRHPFREIEVMSDGHSIEIQQLQSLIHHLVKKNFYSLDAYRLQNQVSLLPWAETVSVRRIWPDRLRISIKEHKAAAIWNETRLLTANGTLFQPQLSSFPTGLPLLSGPTAKNAYVLDHYFSFAQALKRYHLQMDALALKNQAWRLTLASGAVVLLTESESQLQLRHFFRLYRKLLLHRMKDVAKIDLRYADGVAVQWKNTVFPTRSQHNKAQKRIL